MPTRNQAQEKRNVLEFWACGFKLVLWLLVQQPLKGRAEGPFDCWALLGQWIILWFLSPGNESFEQAKQVWVNLHPGYEQWGSGEKFHSWQILVRTLKKLEPFPLVGATAISGAPLHSSERWVEPKQFWQYGWRWQPEKAKFQRSTSLRAHRPPEEVAAICRKRRSYANQPSPLYSKCDSKIRCW